MGCKRQQMVLDTLPVSSSRCVPFPSSPSSLIGVGVGESLPYTSIIGVCGWRVLAGATVDQARYTRGDSRKASADTLYTFLSSTHTPPRSRNTMGCGGVGVMPEKVRVASMRWRREEDGAQEAR